MGTDGEVAKMSEQAIDAVSAVPLLLGSVLMLAAGFGVTSSNLVIPAGVVCFAAAVLIKRIFKKTRATP